MAVINKFGELLEQARKEKRWGQNRIAQHLSISQTRYRQLLTGYHDSGNGPARRRSEQFIMETLGEEGRAGLAVLRVGRKNKGAVEECARAMRAKEESEYIIRRHSYGLDMMVPKAVLFEVIEYAVDKGIRITLWIEK